MCGIAGLIKIKGRVSATEKETVQDILAAISHRGPDQNGMFSEDNVILGSQRLILLDQSEAGSQPMVNEEEDIVLVFNGEISNYLELSQKYDLSTKYQMKSNTDTEVLLRLYQELGINCIHELSGMFSFILYDKIRNKVFFVRDFYGITPLFYTLTFDAFYIASEIKGLLKIPHLSQDINIQGIFDLFTLAYIPGSQTPYLSIKELKQGTYIEIDLNTKTHQEVRYYSPRFTPKLWTEDKAIKATREVLLTAVERHLRSDAPLGAMCSGGIDTSSLIGMIKELGKSQGFHTFSLSIQDSAFDESKYQKKIVDYAGTEHHQINIGIEEIYTNFYEHLAFMDEPYGHGAALPTFILAKEAQKYVKGLLSGEGGDELFNAYETHGAHYWKERYLRAPFFIRSTISKIVNRLPVSHQKLSLDFKLKRFCEGVELPMHESHLFWRHVLKDDDKLKFFLGTFEKTSRISKDFFKGIDNLDDFSKLSAWDIEHFFFGDLMVKNDRMCLAHSVESRFPYMDRIVTDLVLTIPSQIKMKGSKRRYIQKEAMKPFLPKEIYNRNGFGLELPFNKWFSGDLKELYKNYFTEEYFENFPFLSWNYFHELLNLHLKQKADLGRFLWTTLILCAWYDVHFISKNAESLRNKVYLNSTRFRKPSIHPYP